MKDILSTISENVTANQGRILSPGHKQNRLGRAGEIQRSYSDRNRSIRNGLVSIKLVGCLKCQNYSINFRGWLKKFSIVLRNKAFLKIVVFPYYGSIGIGSSIYTNIFYKFIITMFVYFQCTVRYWSKMNAFERRTVAVVTSIERI